MQKDSAADLKVLQEWFETNRITRDRNNRKCAKTASIYRTRRDVGNLQGKCRGVFNDDSVSCIV